jgi:uncharacterized protein (TIGR02217 family)
MAVPTFLEARLAETVSAGAVGGPRITGRKKTYLPNGTLFQNFIATKAIHFYDLSPALRSAADFQTLLDAFYIVMLTPYVGFRFKDWRDFTATQANSRCTSIDGSTTLFQLQRVHTFGSITYLRDIKKPCASPAPVIKRTRASVVTTASATVDTTTGVATVAAHVGGDTYTWEGEFDVPVTFVDDEWTGSLEVSTSDLHVQAAAIKLEELLRP